eukprot:scaffold2271_cov130-Cylindrotheca_fusiformis.AAC.9
MAGQRRSKSSSSGSSICSLVLDRQFGKYPPDSFERRASQFFETKELLNDPEIISPHESAIASLSINREEGRFLLAGSSDGTVSIWDISKWGSEHYIRQGSNNNSLARRTAYHPIARSVKVTAAEGLDIPGGHSSSVTHVQWYPVDTGAFLSSASDGDILLWDTNQMTPVLRVNPFDDNNSGGGSCVSQLQAGGDHSLIGTGSWNDAALKLVDVRSGASSHQLTGHHGGISSIQWSPTMPVILASGSKDGTVRLWDIRKSGSRACIAVCNRGATQSAPASKPYKADYSHLRASTKNVTKLISKKRKLEANSLAPNYYQHLQSQHVSSHSSGHVSAVSFFPSGQFLASVGGVNGELLVWDLRESGSPRRLTSKFVSPGGRPAATPLRRKATLKVCDNTIWVGCHQHLLGFGIDGGSPHQILRGHLNSITSLDQLEPGKNLVSGSRDGMILCWGKPRIASFASTMPVLSDDRDNW